MEASDFHMNEAGQKLHRLFVGIPVPGNVAGALAGLSRAGGLDLAGMRWTEPGKMHITLRFLGGAPDAAIERMSRRLETIRSSRFDVVLEGAALFERVGVFLVKVQGSPSLLALQRLVAQAAQEAGFGPEDKPFQAHITLARVRRGTKLGGSAQQKKSVARLDALCRALPARRFAVETMILYESLAGKYLRLKEFELKTGNRE
jgi:2'-5' RNA ligase